jgi:hypothetical protein
MKKNGRKKAAFPIEEDILMSETKISWVGYSNL